MFRSIAFVVRLNDLIEAICTLATSQAGAERCGFGSINGPFHLTTVHKVFKFLPGPQLQMKFTAQEIQLTRTLRRQGSPWEPRVGHYVYDETGFCKQKSPFQDRVYFILNYSYFMRAVGGIDRFKDIMLWLPTWEDLRNMIRNLGVSDHEVADYMRAEHALEAGTEKLALIQLVETIQASTVSPQVAFKWDSSQA